MSRWYQHVLTGKQVEVETLEEDDYYVANASTWSCIAPPPLAPVKQAEAPKTSAAKKKKHGR